MQLESLFKFERDSARALLASERDPKKRKALAERVEHYTRQLERIEQMKKAVDE